MIDSRQEEVVHKIKAALKLSITEALGIDHYGALKDLAKKRQILLQCPKETEETLEEASLTRYKREQYKLDYIKQLQDLQTVVEILGLNRIESNQLVY